MAMKRDYTKVLSEVKNINTNRINEFVALWEGETNSEKFWIEIDGRKEDLYKYKKFHMDFEAIRKDEKLLENKFNILKGHDIDTLDENDTIEVVHLLNAIYSTRLDNPTKFAIELHKLLKGGLLREIQFSRGEKDNRYAAECVDCIATITPKSAYSFATKFCNRINPSRFPIYDSYVDFLLYHSVDCKRRELKDYERFIEIYDSCREQWKIDSNINYKHIDIFMWTYGKAVKRSQKIDMSSSEQYVKIKENGLLKKINENYEAS